MVRHKHVDRREWVNGFFKHQRNPLREEFEFDFPLRDVGAGVEQCTREPFDRRL